MKAPEKFETSSGLNTGAGAVNVTAEDAAVYALGVFTQFSACTQE
jgi:hypothetical protein